MDDDYDLMTNFLTATLIFLILSFLFSAKKKLT